MEIKKNIITIVLVVLHSVATVALFHGSSHGGNSHTPSQGSSYSNNPSSSSDDDGESIGGNSGCHRCHCDEYREIMKLESTANCMDENRVFPMLKALNDKSHTCRKYAIDHLAKTFAQVTATPSTCQCSGHNNFHRYSSSGKDFPYACFPDRSFDNLYNHYFYHMGEPVSPPQCRSHHAIWAELARVSSTEYHSLGGKSCQQLLVEHVGDLFKRYDSCSCKHAESHYTSEATKPTVATTEKPVVSTTEPPTTSTAQMQISGKYKCGKLSTVESIAIQQHLDQASATPCSSSNRAGTDESFVLTNCNTPDPSQWKQGINVIQHCTDIPTYTPIATFVGGHYYPSMAESGIFLGCIADGFKLGVQHCNATPTIDHVIRSSTGLQNAALFYVID